MLLNCFLQDAAEVFKKKKPTPPPELCSYLTAYGFPGNVREMRAMVFDAVAKHTKGVLSIESFRESIGAEFSVPAPVDATSHRSIVLRHGAEERLPTLAEAEAVLIEQALNLAEGNQGVAASYLGISRNALNKRIIRGRV